MPLIRNEMLEIDVNLDRISGRHRRAFGLVRSTEETRALLERYPQLAAFAKTRYDSYTAYNTKTFNDWHIANALVVRPIDRVLTPLRLCQCPSLKDHGLPPSDNTLSCFALFLT